MLSVHIVSSSVIDKQMKNTESRKTWRWNDFLLKMLFIVVIAEVFTLVKIYANNSVEGPAFSFVVSFVFIALCCAVVYYIIEIYVDRRFNRIVEEEEALKQVVNKMYVENKNAKSDNNKANNKYMPNMRASSSSFTPDEVKFKARVHYTYNN